MFSGFLETLLQFILVISLSNKRYSYHLWLPIITKSGKKCNTFNRLQIANWSVFPSNISLPENRPIKFLYILYITVYCIYTVYTLHINYTVERKGFRRFFCYKAKKYRRLTTLTACCWTFKGKYMFVFPFLCFHFFPFRLKYFQIQPEFVSFFILGLDKTKQMKDLELNSELIPFWRISQSNCQSRQL